MAIGYSGNVRRFASKDHYASYTGTAPIEVSSGPRKIFRVSKRGNRQLNHAIHIVAVTQIRVSDAIFRQLQLDASRRPGEQRAREGKQGTAPKPARPAHTLKTGSSVKPLPGPVSAFGTGPKPCPEVTLGRKPRSQLPS